MGSFIKKNWFVCILIVLFTGVSVYYIYDTNKGKLKGKSSNGEDVVYEINGEDVTTGAFYDALYKSTGASALSQAFQKAVLEQSMETTETMKENAATQAETIISNYKSSYPSTYNEELDDALQQMGYEGKDDLEAYLINYYKELQLVGEYCEEHFDELNIRDISYILISKGDDDSEESISEETQEKMDAVDAALESGESYYDVASEYSEDSSTASDGGYLGTIDANTSSLDSAFQEASLALETGEISDWVYSDNFGYFKILCNASTAEDLKTAYMEREAKEAEAEEEEEGDTEEESDAEATATAESEEETVIEEATLADLYYSLYYSYDTSLTANAIYEKAEALGLEFSDESIEEKIKLSLGIETEESEEEEDEDNE